MAKIVKTGRLYMKGIIKVVCLVMVVFVVGCDKVYEPISKETKSNGIVVEKLFTNDGCTIYRFVDDGYTRYYSDCRGTVMQDIIVRHGKRVEEVPSDIVTIK